MGGRGRAGGLAGASTGLTGGLEPGVAGGLKGGVLALQAASHFRLEQNTSGLAVHPENWELYQRLLLCMIAPEPAVLKGVLQESITRTNGGAALLKDDSGRVLNTVVSEHAAIGHSSELA